MWRLNGRFARIGVVLNDELTRNFFKYSNPFLNFNFYRETRPTRKYTYKYIIRARRRQVETARHGIAYICSIHYLLSIGNTAWSRLPGIELVYLCSSDTRVHFVRAKRFMVGFCCCEKCFTFAYFARSVVYCRGVTFIVEKLESNCCFLEVWFRRLVFVW